MSNVERQSGGDKRQPIFLLPGVITALVGSLVAVHLAALFVLDDAGVNNVLIWMAFIAQRFYLPAELPGGALPLLWTGFTHAFLHIDFMHLLLNSAWLMVFGTPVARRYGVIPTLAVFLLGALAGAVVVTVSQAWHVNQLIVVIGASGGVSALMGASVRFIFQPVLYARDEATGAPIPLGRRTAGLAELVRNPRARAFVLVWLAINLAVPLLNALNIAVINVAWEAHVGGFVLGLFLPALFDRQARAAAQRP